LFEGTLDEVLADWDFDNLDDMDERRELLQGAFRRAAELVMKRSVVTNASPPNETLAWCIIAMRALHCKNTAKLEHALDAFGALKTYFHPDPSNPSFPFKLMHGSRFYNLISRLANQTAEERIAELQSDDSLPDLEKREDAMPFASVRKDVPAKGRRL